MHSIILVLQSEEDNLTPSISQMAAQQSSTLCDMPAPAPARRSSVSRLLQVMNAQQARFRANNIGREDGRQSAYYREAAAKADLEEAQAASQAAIADFCG